MKKISILTSGHPPYDERIFWKFALSLKENGFSPSILCSTQNISEDENGIILKGFDDENISKSEKINKLKDLITQFSPDYIICCEPLTILAARKYKKQFNRKCKIVSDVTEWYPENVAFKFSGLKRYLVYVGLFFFNLFTSNLTDAIIIGEWRKKRRYDFISPFKKKVIIGYYPILKFFEYALPVINDELVLCYAGLIKKDRGILDLFRIAEAVAGKHPEINVKLKLVGKFENKDEEKEIREASEKISNVKIHFAGWTTYNNISELLKDVHICFDLRYRNFIYNNSLPIKIFEYMACGKPFIYSDIKPIRDVLGNGLYGQLVDPGDSDSVIAAVEKYYYDVDLMTSHSRNARRIIENQKNWEMESKKLISFINGL